MRDYIDGRIWADHGHLFAEQVSGFFRSLMDGFRTLSDIEFRAPWRDAR